MRLLNRNETDKHVLPMNDEYYWSLILEPGWVQAAIWTIEEKVARVVAVSSVMGWETEDTLLEAANGALSDCIQDFPSEDHEPTKTVFGVPPSWVVDGQIAKEQLGKIRMLCSKLSLTPSGFVVLPEAIAHAIKIDEGSPLNGVVIGVGKSIIDVTVFRLGNLAGTVNVGRSVSLVDDVVEGLARFATGETLPSRFLIYDGKDGELEDARQVLIDNDWLEGGQEKMNFLHTPKVEIIDAKKRALAICLAGASEITEIVGVSIVKTESEEKTNEDFGQEEIHPSHGNIVEGDDVSPEDVGFILGEDVKKMPNNPHQAEAKLPFVVHGGNQDDNSSPSPVTPMERKKFAIPALPLPNVKRILMKIKKGIKRQPSLPASHLPPVATPRRMMMIVGLIALVALLSLGALWWYIPRAAITVYISPQTLEEKVSLTLDESATSPDVSSHVLPGEPIQIEVTGDKTRSATGRKTVGDKAKGKVTIRNGTANGIKLNAGTSLIGSNDLEFSTGESASVSGAVSPSSPGTVTIEVTASDIGSDYNLGKGDLLKVGSFPKSEVDAVIDEGLTGGSSREIVAVSKNDLKVLEDELTSELKEQGQQELASKVTSEQVFIPQAIKMEATNKDFSHKEGDEASDITLTMTMKVTGLVVKKDLLNQISQSALESKVPEGFVLRQEQVEQTYDLVEEDNGRWTIETTFVVNLLPDISSEEIASKLSGKSRSQASKYLSTIPGYSRAELKVSPQLPGKLGTIPRVVSHIEVEMAADR